MNSHEATRFAEWFDVLAITHRLQASGEMRDKMKAEYFDVLASFPFEAVETSYQNLRRKMKKWPVPADWLEALPPFGSVARLPPLTAEESRMNDEAEKLGYERDEFCHCAICERDDATHLKSRYVPILDRDGAVIERRSTTRTGRPVVLGHWIHGNELKRWYSARAQYYELKDVLWKKILADKTMRFDKLDRLAMLEEKAREIRDENRA